MLKIKSEIFSGEEISIFSPAEISENPLSRIFTIFLLNNYLLNSTQPHHSTVTDWFRRVFKNQNHSPKPPLKNNESIFHSANSPVSKKLLKPSNPTTLGTPILFAFFNFDQPAFAPHTNKPKLVETSVLTNISLSFAS